MKWGTIDERIAVSTGRTLDPTNSTNHALFHFHQTVFFFEQTDFCKSVGDIANLCQG